MLTLRPGRPDSPVATRRTLHPLLAPITLLPLRTLRTLLPNGPRSPGGRPAPPSARGGPAWPRGPAGPRMRRRFVRQRRPAVDRSRDPRSAAKRGNLDARTARDRRAEPLGNKRNRSQRTQRRVPALLSRRSDRYRRPRGRSPPRASARPVQQRRHRTGRTADISSIIHHRSPFPVNSCHFRDRCLAAPNDRTPNSLPPAFAERPPSCRCGGAPSCPTLRSRNACSRTHPHRPRPTNAAGTPP